MFDVDYREREKKRDLLIKLRSDLTGELHTLPYTVYRDSDIERLLDKEPKSIEELVAIRGFPVEGKRVKGFGEAIVSIFNDSVEKIEVVGRNGSTEVVTKLKPMSLFGELQ